MDFSGWNHLQHHTDEGSFISASDITGPDRVLLVGYDVDRNYFTVSLTEGGDMIEIDSVDWNGRRTRTAKARWQVGRLYPSKRVYARKTDLSFAMLLKQRGGTPTYIDIPEED